MKINFKIIITFILIAIILTLYVTFNNSNFSSDLFYEDNSNTNSITDEITYLDSSLTEDDSSYDIDTSTATVINEVSNDSVTITESGVYKLSGTYTEFSLIVNIDKDQDSDPIYIILDNVAISNSSTAPINIIEAKDVILIVNDGSTNTIYQSEITTTDEEFPSGAIYSKADTMITGTGSLDITTLYNDGINCRDDLVITNANITIDAIYDGIVAKDYLEIEDSSLSITCGKDGIKTSNIEDADKGNILLINSNITITSEYDAISSENTIQIDSGVFNIYSGNGYEKVLAVPSSGGTSNDAVLLEKSANLGEILEGSRKGIKAETNIIINDGTFNLSCYEDAINSNGNIQINNGTFNISSGDDGITAENNVTIENGEITIEHCFEGLEGYNITINDGNINIMTDDDGINISDSNGLLYISGGNIYIKYDVGGDGIDCNGSYTQTGGDIIVTSDYEADERNAHLDVAGTVTMSGGTIVDENGDTISNASESSGSSMMMPSTQNRR